MVKESNVIVWIILHLNCCKNESCFFSSICILKQVMRWLLEARDYKAQKCQQSLTGSEFIFSNWRKSKQLIYLLCIIKLTSGGVWHCGYLLTCSCYKRNLFSHTYCGLYLSLPLMISIFYPFDIGTFCCNVSCSREETKRKFSEQEFLTKWSCYFYK